MTRDRVLMALAAAGLLVGGYVVAPPLALVATAALLFDVLLSRSGLSRPALTGIVALHVLLLFLVAPLAAPLAGVFCFASGTCAYAALVVRRPAVRLAVLAATHGLFIASCAQVSAQLALVFGGALAVLTALFLVVGVVGVPSTRLACGTPSKSALSQTSLRTTPPDLDTVRQEI